MDAVTSSWPPAGAPTLGLVVWMRPDVHELPEPSAVMLRSPLPSRWTLLVEFVMVSISPVPKFEPGPVSYIHWESAPEPAAPLKSSLNTVDQPEGGPGTAAGKATAARAVSRAATDADAGAAGAAAAANAAGWPTAADADPVLVLSATIGAAAATRMASLRPQPDPSPAPRKGFLARPSKTVIGRNLRLAAAHRGNLSVNKL